jgi:16S rRNA (uracil1498-N3)-methyltransferase
VSSLPRFFVETPLAGGEVSLPAHTARQITTVLRLRAGAPIVLFDGSGGEWRAELTHAGRGEAAARLLAHELPAREPERRITLCVALLKGDKLEWVLQKATEIGVAAFVPMVTERVVAARAAEGGALTRLERWRRIIVEAAEQSGRTAIPALNPPAHFAHALVTPETKLLCWEGERAAPLGATLGGAEARNVRLFVGPEGGFTPDEVRAAAQAGATVVTLGPRTLRAETAALVAATLALLAPPLGP